MNITVKSICGTYQEVRVDMIETGTMDDKEARELAYNLLVAAEELLLGSGGDVYDLHDIHEHLAGHL